ncbi:MAG TPA: DNA-binding protein WhiA [Candidatus Corynebacterium gallistercoris]|uniref:Probable cell division protein WhiA n=1 Tax=Candidatus Corynebacterium gallistercoris TaxID=2838530 RepID=A0A9D1URC0_9CORY|nr:DNA-binding protein WhiA [Candidatus Corynebacterium gallistercoris]
MALTSDVKAELNQVVVTRLDERTAELASLLRYTAGLHLVAGKIVIESEVDSETTAQRMMDAVEDMYGHSAELQIIGANNLRRSPRYIVRWEEGGLEIARRTELIDRAGRPVRGLPRFIIGGTREQCVAAWRGAFLAHGHLTDPGRSSALEVSTPSNEAALALVGAARRIDVPARTKEARGAHRVLIRDGEAISRLLELIGATDTREEWEKQRQFRENRAKANRLANFDDANLRRSARAAAAAAVRVKRALEILGEDVPPHLAEAGQLRVQHKEASLEELGRLAEPAMTKDAVAGRIRRLLSMADKRAEELGIDDTQAAVTEEMIDDLE